MAQVFKKRYPNNPVMLSTGKGLRFEDTGNNYGFLVTDDPKVISELEAAMAAGRGGIQKSTMLEYDEAVKKKTSSQPSFSKLAERQTSGLVTITQTLTPPAATEAANLAAADVVDAKAILTPTINLPAQEPRVGRRSKNQ